MNGCRSSSRRFAGFTLIEVMLALAILTVGMVVLIAAASRCLAVVKASRIYEEARHLVGLVEVEQPLDPEKIEVGVESGRFDPPYQDYRWSREVAVQGEDEEDGLYRIHTRISWSERGRGAHEDVETLLYVPPEDEHAAP